MASRTIVLVMLAGSFAPAGAHSCENGAPCSCSKAVDETSGRCFEVTVPGDHEVVRSFATECETIRKSLQTKWFGSPGKAWRPRCIIVMHADRERYLAAVGRGGLMTHGCSRVTFDGDRIIGRRIDLCGEDRDRVRSALAHEMSHIVLADRFGRGSLPRWADEGIAVLADSTDKQARHHADLQDAMRGGMCLPFGYLAALESPPAADRVAVFYGQAASWTRFLAQRKEPREFVRFLEKSQRAGYDEAAKEIYGFADARAMEREWQLDVERQATAFTKTSQPAVIPVVADSKSLIARRMYDQ